MNLIDKKVSHKLFGEGSIINHNSSSIEVSFAAENKKFIYPDAFAKFLTLHDQEGAKVIEAMIQVKEEELKAVELEKEAERLRQVEKQKMLMEYERLMQNHKLHEESQMVFWCDAEEKENVFDKWVVYTGSIQSGVNKGKPSKAVRLHRNSAVLLTARDAGTNEQERRIIGMYMVKEDFIGKLSEDGLVPAHSTYKLQLTEEESDKLLFWRYYTNKNAPEKTSWNTGKYRYFNNVWMAQVLNDILSLKEDPEEKQLVQEFLSYFCKMNQLSIDEIGEPTGVLANDK